MVKVYALGLFKSCSLERQYFYFTSRKRREAELTQNWRYKLYTFETPTFLQFRFVGKN